MGYHHIDIIHRSYGKYQSISSACEIRPLYIDSMSRQSFIRPTFQLQKVCRQLYVETASIVYTLNTFGFNNYQTFDRWTKQLSVGQKRLVASVDMPSEYMRLYRNGTRKLFREKFPNIKRIGVDLSCAYYAQHMNNETLSRAKQSVVDSIKEKEGAHVVVAWHAGTAGSLVYY